MVMDNNKCSKCHKTFSNKYNLEKHLKKKIPCDRIIKCTNCNKVFKTISHLTRHMNRKNPCQSINEKEKEFEQELIILDKKKEIKLELMDKQLEIEKEKTNRKQLCSTTTINNNNSNNIIINAPTYNVNVFSVENVNNNIEKNILTLGMDVFKSIMDELPDAKDKIVKILELTYKNEDTPECQNLIYTPTCDKFFALKDKDWEEIAYDKIKTIVLGGVKKVLFPYMDDYKQNGKFIMNSRDMMVADPNMDMHFQLSSCNTFIKESDKTKKKEKEIKKVVQDGLEKT